MSGVLKISLFAPVLLSMLLVGCSPDSGQPLKPSLTLPTAAALPSRTPVDSQQITPTLPGTAAVANTSSPPTRRPSPAADCQDDLQFVADLTIPDGSMLARLAEVDKRWQVQNTGTCSWDSRYKLIHILGPDLGMPAEQSLYPARAGAAAVIRMLLTTPLEPGVYTSAWQAQSPVGELFGDVIYIEFQVN